VGYLDSHQLDAEKTKTTRESPTSQEGDSVGPCTATEPAAFTADKPPVWGIRWYNASPETVISQKEQREKF